MPTATSPLPEFGQEMATTRRLLERVPEDKSSWQPHSKSFPLGHLAQLVASMPGWIASTIREPVLDLATYPGYGHHSTEALVAMFDASVAAAGEALAGATKADLAEPWSLKHGPHVLWTAPKGVVIRNHLNHLIHHRGQLTVYLRLVEVPIPPIYGPTADERP